MYKTNLEYAIHLAYAVLCGSDLTIDQQLATDVLEFIRTLKDGLDSMQTGASQLQPEKTPEEIASEYGDMPTNIG